MWSTAWHLVYSADDKCRCEHLERIRRAAVLDDAIGKRPDNFDPETPWSYCFIRAASDENFWNENVRHPAAAWVAAGARSELLTPDERHGTRALPGGREALKVETEPTNSQKKRHARKVRTQAAKEELHQFRSNKGPAKGKGKTKMRHDASGR
eukprot:5607530-Amphidinium_carterae.1